MFTFNITKCQVWIQYTIMIEIGMLIGMVAVWAIMS